MASLVEKTITRDGAFRASPKDEGILAVSHRWFNPAQPDKDGLQLHEIKEHLVKHEELKFVWFDYWCMPQGERTPAEDVAFLHMLKKINWRVPRLLSARAFGSLISEPLLDAI